MPSQFSSTVRYLYFLRFSLMLWLFPFVFALLDSGKLSISTSTLSRGIFVPEYMSGYLCVAFFVIATGCVSLITARTVVINGVERFGCEAPGSVDELLKEDNRERARQQETGQAAPDWLRRLLANDRCIGETRAVVVAQLPALLALLYLIGCGYFEMVPLHRILWGLFFGTLLAAMFWYVVNAVYYLAYEPPRTPKTSDVLELGKNAARTILLPRKWFWLRIPGEGASSAEKTLEDITTSLRHGRFATLLGRFTDYLNMRWKLVGYLYDNGRIYEAQMFSFLAAVGFTFLFWIICPLTAPRPNRWVLVAFLVSLGSLGWILKVVLSGTCDGAPGVLRFWKLGITILSLVFWLAIPTLWLLTSPDRFPTLASILLMVIVLGWVFSALAFFFDRFRVPVLTFVLVVLLLPRLPHRGGFEEHYISTVPLNASAGELPTPAEILAKHLSAPGAKDDQRPYIIITATGGGLHASAWTTRVIQQIYFSLPPEDRKVFANHLLLLSTVSGGSVGASYYLQAIHEAHANAPGAEDAPEIRYLEKMRVAAQCSSLEAVGWGLVYYDFIRALAPGFPWFTGASSGDGDLDDTPMFKDRTWNLRKSIERNYYDPYCYNAAGLEVREPVRDRLWLLGRPNKYLSYKSLFFGTGPATDRLTIDQLPAGAGFPAFTMNTTTAEGGDRFLLSNYRLPRYTLGPSEGLPAESFLDLFCKNHPRPDLPLSSAAQLSATFPYVSSAARVPLRYTSASAHFVDGGYYDDDGTSSAIEFLRYALIKPRSCASADLSDEERAQCLLLDKLSQIKLKILLIEIRNSDDIDAPGRAITPKALNPDQVEDSDPHPAGLLQQLGFPLEGFWNAGHVSVTGRDRNGLDLLRSALEGHLDIHQIIFDDEPPADQRWYIDGVKDPLSWSLTPRQRAEVTKSAIDLRLEECYTAVKTSFEAFDKHPESEVVRRKNGAGCKYE